MSFTVEKKTIDAFGPRVAGSTLLQDDKLQIVYNKYKTKSSAPIGAIKFNLVFAHGIGMNKSIWKYHIKRLYALNSRKWFLDSVLSIDAVGHGDSAVANYGKLGWISKWDDHSRDINQILRHEHATSGDFIPKFDNKTVIIGHSFGGFASIIAAVLEPSFYSSIIAIEPVIYGTAESAALFGKRFSKVGDLIMDDFESKEQIVEYFSQFHFFKNFNPEILKDFIEDESTEGVDENGEKYYRVKCNKFNQMTCYFSAAMSIPFGMGSLQTLSVPIEHIIGKKANWNPKEATEFIRSSIPSDVFLKGLDLDGEHLLNAEQPETTLQAIIDHLDERAVFSRKQWEEQPEVVHLAKRDVIRDEQFALILAGDIGSVSGYRLLAKF